MLIDSNSLHSRTHILKIYCCSCLHASEVPLYTCVNIKCVVHSFTTHSLDRVSCTSPHLFNVSTIARWIVVTICP